MVSTLYTYSLISGVKVHQRCNLHCKCWCEQALKGFPHLSSWLFKFIRSQQNTCGDGYRNTHFTHIINVSLSVCYMLYIGVKSANSGKDMGCCVKGYVCIVQVCECMSVLFLVTVEERRRHIPDMTALILSFNAILYCLTNYFVCVCRCMPTNMLIPL